MEPFRKTCGFDFYIVGRKIKKEILNGRIEKIYFIKREDGYVVKFMVYKNQKKFLIITDNAIACYENDIVENPHVPSTFTMVLRKHLEDKFITDVLQCNNDKILSVKTANHILYLEFFGKGNVVLCDNENKIIDALIKREWKGRAVKHGEIYKFPENTLSEKAVMLFFGAYFNEVKENINAAQGNPYESGINFLGDKEGEISGIFKNLIAYNLKRDYEMEKIEKDLKKLEFIAGQQRTMSEELNDEVLIYSKIGDEIYLNSGIIEEILENAKNKVPDSRIKRTEGTNVVAEI